MANPQVVVDFIANTSKLSHGFSEAGKSSDSFGSRLKSLGKAAVVAGGAAGLAVLTATLKTGIDELTETAKVSAQTQAVLKSTGGAAHVTAQQVKDLADQLSLKTTYDHNAIQSGENLLLTFRNVQNQAGKGNDIFNQATQVMLDMSTALGQNMKSSAIQLGKALNDPVKGITALRRVGVSFTQAQQDQIKALVKSGDVLGAQKIILGELTKEFGGSAEAAGKTLPGQLKIMNNSFKELAGSITQLLLPAFTAITGFFTANPGLARAMVIGIIALSAAMVALNVVLGVTTGLAAAFDIAFLPAIGILAAIVAGVAALIAIGVLLYKNWDTVSSVFSDAVDTMKKVAQDVFGWLKSNWPYLVGILTGPIGLAAAAIYKNWDAIQRATTSAWNSISSTITNVVNTVKNTVSNFAQAVWDVFQGSLTNAINFANDLWDTITNAAKDAFTSAVKAVSGFAQSVWDVFQGSFNNAIGYAKGLWHDVMQAAWDAWDGIKNALNGMAQWVWNLFQGTFTNAIQYAKDLWNSLMQGAWDAWNGVKNAFNAAIDWLWGFVHGALAAAVNAAKNMFHFITDGAWDVFNGVKDALNSVVDFIWGIVQRVGGAANAIANAIKAPINAVIGAWNSLKIPRVAINIPSVKIFGHKIGGGSIGFGPFDFPNIPYLARGGIVDQPTLAMLGEAGREIVTPENLLREIVASAHPQVHVYIGDQELTQIVKTQVVDVNTGIARTLLAGAA